MPEITPRNLREVEEVLFGSAATDVTGGMASKVNQSLELVRDLPGLEILIFSGEEPRAVQDALAGENRGTLIHS
jgi:isopentenyl phosphate kinase